MSEKISGKSRRLLIVPFERLEEAFKKGNADYVRHYESYFDEIHALYFYGFFPETVQRGKTAWLSVGSKHHKLDFFLAPLRVLRATFLLKPSAFLTQDLVFSWWSMVLVRWIYRGQVVLVPICYPEEIYALGKRSITAILPIWLERLFMRLSFYAATKILISKQNHASISWLKGNSASAKKTQIIDVIPEQFPAPELLDELLQSASKNRELHTPARLLYVGRLHWQKLVLELVDLMGELLRRGVQARLLVAGDGPDMLQMKERAREMGVEENIEWLGFVGGKDLGLIYRNADVFVSTVTGTALREAAFSGLPVVGYDLKFFKGLLQNDKNALLAPVHDVVSLAAQVDRALSNRGLRARIAKQLHADILTRWDTSLIPCSLADAFPDKPSHLLVSRGQARTG
jgi:glycosyltransferase involved in cell wall biosynthesis